MSTKYVFGAYRTSQCVVDRKDGTERPSVAEEADSLFGEAMKDLMGMGESSDHGRGGTRPVQLIRQVRLIIERQNEGDKHAMLVNFNHRLARELRRDASWE